MTDWQTIGFGCPNELDPHHFVVGIPAGRTAEVVITEHYGIKTGIHGNPEIAERCYLPRQAWSAISEDVKREFNQRLKEKQLPTSRWSVGENKVERLLGKELLVLAWAVEQADISVIPNAIRNWVGLKPEERWWLYTMTAAATGGPDDAGIGWRKALQHALTENPLKDIPPTPSQGTPTPRKRQKPKDGAPQMRLPIPGFSDEAQSVFAPEFQKVSTARGVRWN
jgi:hypothetical protein